MIYNLYTLQNTLIEKSDFIPGDFTGIVEDYDGTKTWFFNGNHHRLDGPAYEYKDGTKAWWVNGKRHRIDGPAHEGRDNSKFWYVGGKLHKLNGPACEYPDGRKFWYIGGEKIFCNTDEEFKLLVDTMKLKGLL